MTIKEVSEKYDITADTLRYYERVGLIPPVPRSNGRIRNYDEISCKWIQFAKCLRKSGVQMEALVKYVALYRQGDATVEERKNILIEERKFLADRIKDMQTVLELLDRIIERGGRMGEDCRLNL